MTIFGRHLKGSLGRNGLTDETSLTAVALAKEVTKTGGGEIVCCG